MNTNTIEQELTIEERIKDLNKLVLSGQMMEAFEKYYHEDVVMQENDNAAMVGKNANRQREKEFLNNVEGFKPAVIAVATAGDVSFVVWSYDFSHKEWGVKKYTQVSVQRWKDGKIIHEQFFYNG